MSPWRLTLVLVFGPALLSAGAQAADPFTSLHPEEAIPDPKGEVPQSPYSEFIKKVQARLQQLGFDAGPVNGYFGEKTQAALAQFQLDSVLPASGSLDDQTLAALGVEREQQQAAADTASTGASGQAKPEEQPRAPDITGRQPAEPAGGQEPRQTGPQPAQQQLDRPQEPKSEKPAG